MEEESITEINTGHSAVSTTLAQNFLNQPLSGKAYLIYPALPKDNNIYHEIKLIQRKLSALRIDFTWRELPPTRSKKRRLRKKRQDLARRNKSTVGLEKVAVNTLVVQNTTGEVNVINSERNRKNNTSVGETFKENTERNESVIALSSKRSSHGLEMVAENSPMVENTEGKDDCINDAVDANVIASAREILKEKPKPKYVNEYMHEKDDELFSRKRKQCLHSSTNESQLHFKRSKSGRESAMSANSQIKVGCSLKINELTAENSMNNELSTQEGDKIELLINNATINLSNNASAEHNKLSAQKLKKTKHFSKHKSKSYMSKSENYKNIDTKSSPISLASKLYSNKVKLYAFEVTGSSNLLPTEDIIFLLKLQNSFPLNEWFVESRKKNTKGKSVITVGLEPATVTFLESVNFEASLLKSKVAFVVKKFTIIPVYSCDKPFLWLGKWGTFRTVLNEKSDKNE